MGSAAEGSLIVEPLSPLILEVKGWFFIESQNGSKCGFVATGGCVTMRVVALGGTEVSQHQSKLVFRWTLQLVCTNTWNEETSPISTPLGYMGDIPDAQIPH